MTDVVNHPNHYAEGWSNGAEVIDITENLNFNRGNAVKYIARAGKKDSAKELEDLRKAEWYLSREIERFTKVKKSPDLTLDVKKLGYTIKVPTEMTVAQVVGEPGAGTTVND